MDKKNDEAVQHRAQTRTPPLDLNSIHRDPLPINLVPALPPIIPHNPLSIISYVWAWLFPGSAEPCQYYGTINHEQRCIQVSDETSITHLWRRGFFGKGTLSRSEPTWHVRTLRQLGLIGVDEALTAEEVTARRRQERKLFKQERARKEAEERQRLLVEEGKMAGPVNGTTSLSEPQDRVPSNEDRTATLHLPNNGDRKGRIDEIPNLECLQLASQEAMFLAYFLGVLTLYHSNSSTVVSRNETLTTIANTHTHTEGDLHADNDFIFKYVAYHHYRSRGWIVKMGTKFAVDYLLYKKGPAFSHSEFAVVVIPSYDTGSRQASESESPEWHWFHMINRVQSQVRKNLILCYVSIPNEEKFLKCLANDDVASLLRLYSVREFALKRWVASRQR